MSLPTNEFWKIVGSEPPKMTGERLLDLSKMQQERLIQELGGFTPKERARVQARIDLLREARGDLLYA